jgi:hypothetical protein
MRLLKTVKAMLPVWVGPALVLQDFDFAAPYQWSSHHA